MRSERSQRQRAVQSRVSDASASAAATVGGLGRARQRNSSDPAVKDTTIILRDASEPTSGIMTNRPSSAPERQPTALAVFISPSSQERPGALSAGLRSSEGKIVPSKVADGTMSSAATRSLNDSARKKLPLGTAGSRKVSCARSHERNCPSTARAQHCSRKGEDIVAPRWTRQAPSSNPTRTMSSIEEKA